MPLISPASLRSASRIRTLCEDLRISDREIDCNRASTVSKRQASRRPDFSQKIPSFPWESASPIYPERDDQIPADTTPDSPSQPPARGALTS